VGLTLHYVTITFALDVYTYVWTPRLLLLPHYAPAFCYVTRLLPLRHTLFYVHTAFILPLRLRLRRDIRADYPDADCIYLHYGHRNTPVTGCTTPYRLRLRFPIRPNADGCRSPPRAVTYARCVVPLQHTPTFRFTADFATCCRSYGRLRFTVVPRYVLLRFYPVEPFAYITIRRYALRLPHRFYIRYRFLPAVRLRFTAVTPPRAVHRTPARVYHHYTALPDYGFCGTSAFAAVRCTRAALRLRTFWLHYSLLTPDRYYPLLRFTPHDIHGVGYAVVGLQLPATPTRVPHGYTAFYRTW